MRAVALAQARVAATMSVDHREQVAGLPAEERLHLALLELKNLHVALEDGTPIVKGVDLAVDANEVHAIMGPNGSGKSTLAYAIAGHPAYQITEGQILLDGEDITEAGGGRARPEGALPRIPVSARHSRRDGDELPAHGDQRDPQGARRRRRPDAGQGVPHRASRRWTGSRSHASLRRAT